MLSFNPRTHKGCDPQGIVHSNEFVAFQSTHPQRVRRPRLSLRELHTWVSIHAPTKGATETIFTNHLVDIVSIHAPTKGATNTQLGRAATNLFQSTHPQRVRPEGRRGRAEFQCFNPRTHKGCDWLILIAFITEYKNSHIAKV